MADVRTIIIDNKPQVGTALVILRNGIIWTYLVGAEAASHMLFGGSWVIDIMVLLLLGVYVTRAVTREGGLVVKMTPAEIRRWVAAGMPNDVKAWREASKLSGVA